jgi:hypothetical protein
MSTIPFSVVSNVIPSVLSASGAAVDLNGLILTQNPLFPSGQIEQFSSAAAVGAYCGQNSTEYTMAQIYFNGFKNCSALPGNLMFAFYPETAAAGFLRSASLAALTLTQLQALSGTLIITVAGTQFTSSTITLSGAASFSAAATTIQAAFTSPTFTVTFNSTTNAFIFTTTVTGATATITYCTGTLAAGLSLTAATGAVLSQGVALGVPATFMNSILQLNQNWACFGTAWQSVQSEQLAFGAWAAANQPRYLYVMQDMDVNITGTANSTEVVTYQMNQLSTIGVLPIYGNTTHVAFAMGWAASLNFNKLNGRTTLAFQSQSGLAPTVTTLQQYTNAISNGYNVYGIFGSNNPANNQNWMAPGSVLGNWLWADSYVNQIWLNANLQLANVNLMTSVGQIPYNTQGNSLVYNAGLTPINAALNFGAINTGVALNASQISQIKVVLGFDPSASLYQQGFYYYIGVASAQVRAARGSPPCTLYYCDGGSIQQITLASISVQ